MALTLYSSTDAGAPVLDNSIGSLTNLFKACLVDGYGNKPALGWVCPFGVTNGVGVFQQGLGSNQKYLRVDNSSLFVSTYYSSQYYAKVNSYEVMTDLNTGTGVLPTTTQVSNGFFHWFFWNTGANKVAPARWYLVGDASYFIFIVEAFRLTTASRPFDPSASTATYVGLYYYGDLEDTGSGDSYATAITNGYGSSVSETYVSFSGDAINMNTGVQKGLFLHRKLDQTGSGVLATTACMFSYGGTSSLKYYQPSTAGAASTVIKYPNNRGKFFYNGLPLIDSIEGTTVIPREYRGYLKGIKRPFHYSTDLLNSNFYPTDTFTDGLKSYMYFMVNAKNSNDNNDYVNYIVEIPLITT